MDKLKIVLASKSPRRQALIKELGFDFEIRTKEVEEIYPPELPPYKVPEFLAALKAVPIAPTLNHNEILLTSDTIVLAEGNILGKPKDKQEAFEMIQTLSGKSHEVITGVQLKSVDKLISFSSITTVYFSPLTTDEISFYIDKYKPMDKAGSYGIQEWIGYIGVSKIEGCYYNVMGLPIHDVYQALKEHFNA
ncbi:MAG: Maf family nucleotide pyrophosphatase [Crocinitomicaceae bacterium]|nr:Maf family nucleotide pyrophosphatase [Crocinitomicaceae bacterium]MDG1777398.1 Maf family nucleotide pyrophosphatase [Crocinitomicaceae bacterium]